MLAAVVASSWGTWPATGAPRPDPEQEADELVLKKSGVTLDGAGMLAFFRQRTLWEGDRERIAGLVRQLGASRYRLRDRAHRALVGVGSPALPFLREGQKNGDAEVRARAARCIDVIEREPGPALPLAAARLLALRRPAGACPVLLAYLPYADNEEVEEEVLSALVRLGKPEGRVDPALVTALNDSVGARRAAAAWVVGRLGNESERRMVRRLLEDGDARVRYRAAQALLLSRDRAAVATLIALLGDGPLELARKAEDLLADVSTTPVTPLDLGASAASRRKVHEAWGNWWRANENKIDLARLEIDGPLAKSARARKAADQCLKAYLRLDLKAFKKTLSVPFYMPGMVNGKNQADKLEELDQQFKVMDNPQIREMMKRISFTIKRVTRLEEYLKAAPDMEMEFLRRLRKTEVFPVHIEVSMGGMGAPNSDAVLFVRVRGGRTAVIGFGNPRQGGGKK
jgi:HEAT repeat protein